MELSREQDHVWRGMSECPWIEEWQEMSRYVGPIIITFVYLERFYNVQCVSEWIVRFHRQINRRLKGKGIPVQAWTGPKSSRSLKLPDFKKIGTWKWLDYQPYVPAPFNPQIAAKSGLKIHEVLLSILFSQHTSFTHKERVSAVCRYNKLLWILHFLESVLYDQ